MHTSVAPEARIVCSLSMTNEQPYVIVFDIRPGVQRYVGWHKSVTCVLFRAETYSHDIATDYAKQYHNARVVLHSQAERELR